MSPSGTLKVVHAVVKGCPVVTMAWVKALAERGKPSDPLPDVQAYPPDWSKVIRHPPCLKQIVS